MEVDLVLSKVSVGGGWVVVPCLLGTGTAESQQRSVLEALAESKTVQESRDADRSGKEGKIELSTRGSPNAVMRDVRCERKTFENGTHSSKEAQEKNNEKLVKVFNKKTLPFHAPSTAAMTTRNRAVSVALVKLRDVRAKEKKKCGISG